jgi:nitroreductase
MLSFLRMQTLDAIQNRRAVRDFTEAPVPRSTIERLIHAATLAPSAMNLQPWAFAVVSSREKTAALGIRAKEWLLAHFEETSLPPSLRDHIKPAEYSLFHGAPALVLVLARSADTQAAEDCCLAAQNLMLAARDEGLGTCWIGLSRPWLNLPSVKRELGVPERYHVIAPVILGYPKSWPESHGRERAEIHWIA